MNKLLILGAGGHGKVVADAAFEMKRWQEIAFLDDQISTVNARYKVLGGFDKLSEAAKETYDVIVAVGDNKKRESLLLSCQKYELSVATIIHPLAFVSGLASIDKGVVILAQAVVNVDATIGLGCIINTGVVIEHDCILGSNVHVSPNATLAGNVIVGDRSWIGAGSSVIENVKIGKDVTIGAGSVVLSDLQDKAVAVGAPAKVIKYAE